MIVSFSRKFIFFKTAKSSSTSLELALRNYCSKGDLVTTVHEDNFSNFKPNPNIYKFKLFRDFFGIYGRQNFKNKYFKYFSKFFYLNFRSHDNQENFFNSLSKKEYKIIQNYYKFTIVRNPYDQIRSLFQYRYKNYIQFKNLNPNIENFNRFIKQYSNNFFKEEKKQFFYKNKLNIDFFIKYENAENDMRVLEKKLGIKNLFANYKNLSAKKNIYKVNNNLLNDETKKLIYELNKDYFDLLGYIK